MFRRLTDLADRRRWLVLLAGLIFVFVAGFFGGPVAGLLTSGATDFDDPGSESVAARERLEQATGVNPDVSVIVLVEPGQDIRGSRARARIEQIAETIERDPTVARVFTAFNTGNPSFVSRDQRSTFVAVSFKPVSARESQQASKRIEEALGQEPGVSVGGPAIAIGQVDDQVEKDLARAEVIAFPLLLVLSLIVFRGLVAALLPIVAGAVSVLGTFLMLRIVNEFSSLSIFAVNVVIGLGLGLAIDYSLFIVSRYREELARVGAGREALRRTLETAGRTVTFSAFTLAAAMASLLVFPQPFLHSMALGGIFVALTSAGAALLVLPAILAALGTRVNALAPARWRRAVDRDARAERAGFWYRLSQAVMHRPGPIAFATATLLIVLGIPFLGIKFTGLDASLLPESASARQVHDELAREFPANQASPIYLAVQAPRSARTDLEAYASNLRDLPGAASVSRPQHAGEGTWRLDIVSRQKALTDSSQALVRDIRRLKVPYEVEVGGAAAAFADQQHSFRSRLPFGLAIIALTAFVLLFAVTGSVVLPIKALLMNILTLSATLGVLVFLFQDGRLEGLLDYSSQGALNAVQPISIAAVGFALSTDYAIFLLTRIKESWDAGASNADAVASGLERTGRIVTAAAVLFCIAIGAFSTSEIVFIKQLGVGTVLVVLLDATLVRGLLVPSLMKLLGDWNWWAPTPLRRVHRRLALSEAS